MVAVGRQEQEELAVLNMTFKITSRQKLLLFLEKRWY